MPEIEVEQLLKRCAELSLMVVDLQAHRDRLAQENERLRAELRVAYQLTDDSLRAEIDRLHELLEDNREDLSKSPEGMKQCRS